MLDAIRKFFGERMEPVEESSAADAERIQLAACALPEVMWGLILADGVVAEHEAYLVRKMANLLGLEAGYLSQARAQAAEKLS
jgi:uncharacterized tellurite resistance protein B-like protein